jgi:peptidoglycan/LPS O-acetylase OafA/YrhL
MKNNLTFINLFRALSAFWVLITHCMIWGDWYPVPIPNPKLAVDVFMIISGFLMAYTSYNRKENGHKNNTKKYSSFLLRRFFRIAPAYYLSLFLAILTSKYFLSGYSYLQTLSPDKWETGGIYDPNNIQYTIKNILLHITFVFGLFPKDSFSTFLPDWSLSLEMQFYMLFPLLAFFLKRNNFIALFTIPLFILGQLINNYYQYSEPSLVLLKINYFVVGILLSKILLENNKAKLTSLLTISIVLLSLEYYTNLYYLIVLLTIFFLMTILGRFEIRDNLPRNINRLINSTPIKFFSDTAYGVYLFHGFFISLFGIIIKSNLELLSRTPMTRVILMIIFVVILGYSFSYILFKTVEKPGIKFGRKIISLFEKKRIK